MDDDIEAIVAKHDDAALDKLIALYDESYGGSRERYPTVKMWIRAFLKAGWTPPKEKP